MRTFLALLCGDCYWQVGHCEVLLGTLSYLRVLGGISGYFQVLLVTLRHNQSPRSHQVVRTHTSSTRAGQCCRQPTERSRNCKAGRAWLQFHHVLRLMNPIALQVLKVFPLKLKFNSWLIKVGDHCNANLCCGDDKDVFPPVAKDSCRCWGQRRSCCTPGPPCYASFYSKPTWIRCKKFVG